jgi:hypothetical protein
MQHLLISVSDSTNLNALKTSLMKHKGIHKVESIETVEKPISAIHPDWKNRLHLPGPPLNDAQLEELVEELESLTEFFTLEEAREKGNKLIDEWHNKSL